jgi:ribosomal protein L19
MLGLSKIVNKFNKEGLLKYNFLIPKVGDVFYVSFQYPYKQKNLTFYSQSFLGVCTSFRKKTQPLSLFFLRNVLGRDPLEVGFFLNSPMIKHMKLVSKASKNKYKKNKLYYLRLKKNYYSRFGLPKKKLK